MFQIHSAFGTFAQANRRLCVHLAPLISDHHPTSWVCRAISPQPPARWKWSVASCSCKIIFSQLISSWSELHPAVAPGRFCASLHVSAMLKGGNHKISKPAVHSQSSQRFSKWALWRDGMYTACSYRTHTHSQPGALSVRMHVKNTCHWATGYEMDSCTLWCDSHMCSQTSGLQKDAKDKIFRNPNHAQILTPLSFTL